MTMLPTISSAFSDLTGPIAWLAAAFLGAGWFWQILARNAETRREQYAEATRSLYRLREMPYRIRRRMSDEPELLGALASRLHDLQEEIDYWRSWTANEHKLMGDAFNEAAEQVRSAVHPCIDSAWEGNHLQHAREMVLKNDPCGPYDLNAATSAIEEFSALSRYRFGPSRLAGLKKRKLESKSLVVGPLGEPPCTA